MSRKVPGALWVPKWAGAPDLVAAFRRARLERGTRWEDSPTWIAGQLGLSVKTAYSALRKLPATGHDVRFLAPIHPLLLPVKLPVRARLLATHLWRRGDPDPRPGAYRVTLRDLGEDFSWSRRITDRAIDRLRSAGVLIEEVVYVQGTKVQKLRTIDLTAIPEGLITAVQKAEAGTARSEATRQNRGRRPGKTAAGDPVKARPVPDGTCRHQPPPTVHGVYTEGGPGAEGRAEKGLPAPAGSGSPESGRNGPAPSGAGRFAFALPPLPNGMPIGSHGDPTWTRALLRETREGLEAGPPGAALAWLLTTLGVSRAYRLGHQLARNSIGLHQVLEHVKRVNARTGVRSKAAVLGTELRDLLQGFR